MSYGIGDRILAIQLAKKWAELTNKGQKNLAEKYYKEAINTFPQINVIMVYGGSEKTGGILAKELIQYKNVPINTTIEDGSTALLYATYLDNTKEVLSLLKLKANPNIPDNSGLTPLICAAKHGNLAAAKSLLAYGANPNAETQGLKAADYARIRGDINLAKFLRDAQSIKPEESPNHSFK